MLRDSEALEYHARGRKGKLEVVPTKPCMTQRDLSLAYTPGVAVPCRAIHADPDAAYELTAKGNLVAVVTNGTAVLGLGDIGPLAGKPVMEGKGVLFKRFADIDVFDLELATHDPDEIIRTLQLLEPTFGGINLEDIKAPECFVIEEALRRSLGIPVFHDDQHGTAIISGAALLNALELVDKRIEDVRVVFNGSGAAGLACARFYQRLGVRPEHLVLCDSLGVVWRGRELGMNAYKQAFASDTGARTLAEALRGADVFVGLSIANCVTAEMVRSMNDHPILFAMANPDPEIGYDEAKRARPDAIVATGRSDFPNQVNNVLGFPFIFRGALDVRATAINDDMMLAATRALADLAKEDVPDSVMKAYGVERLRFGPDYLIPKPFDHRVLIREASAVAEAAMRTGVARIPLDLEVYRQQLDARLGKSREIMRVLMNEARRAPQRLVFPDGGHPSILRTSHILLDEQVARPILLGDPESVRLTAAQLHVPVDGAVVLDPVTSPLYEEYARDLYELRQRKGVTLAEARTMMRNPTVFGAMMVRRGDADALVAGVAGHYNDTLRPALQIIQVRPDVSVTAGVHLMVLKDKVYMFADTTVNIDPTAEQLAEIALCSAEVARQFHVEPRVAMVSFSNFGSARHASVDKVRTAVAIVKRRAPDLMIDGEMQADVAVMPEIIEQHYPFSSLKGGATVLVFPDLASANVAYKLVHRLAGAEAVGPILTGMRRPVGSLQQGVEVKDIVNVAVIAAVEAQRSCPAVAETVGAIAATFTEREVADGPPVTALRPTR